ncbi:hypothetical protein DFH06DRAFT_221037 [Mycena polygramma]|nr:hypothetical protein DFH06DRAFT_221037 [Mycena polygramma]
MRKSPSQLYHRLSSENGIAQLTPEPDENLPEQYKAVGISIGDVGICRDGSFEVLFNACWPAKHSINGVLGVPPGFEPFLLHGHEISKRAYHSPGTRLVRGKVSEVTVDIGASSAATPYVLISRARVRDFPQLPLTSDSVFPTTVGGSITFTIQSKEAAILVLPAGASRENLLPIEFFRAHIRNQSDQWYDFAQDRLPSTESLFVVTGCDKTNSWGIATGTTSSGTLGFSLKFTVVGVADGTLAPRYEWKDFGSATVRMCSSPSTENQCIFIRGFFVPRRLPFLTSVADKILWRGLNRALAKRVVPNWGHIAAERRVRGDTEQNNAASIIQILPPD